MTEIVLAGCAPIPLAGYLKALGTFRLVAEQKDKGVQGCWREEAFVLATTLTREELVRFFLDEYRPSPIISPWNGGSGFYFREGKSSDKDPATGKKLKTGKRDERPPLPALWTASLQQDRTADLLCIGTLFPERERHWTNWVWLNRLLMIRSVSSSSNYVLASPGSAWLGSMRPSPWLAKR